MGCLDVLFDTDGVAVSWSGDTIVLDDSVPHDAAMRAMLEAQ